MIIEKKKLKDLTPAPYNPRTSTKKQEEDLRASLKKFGVVEPIIYNKRTGYIVGGHFKVRELQKMGVEEVDVTSIEEDDTEDLTISEDEALTKLGDIYEIGDHRLLCGDATKIADLNKLMGGAPWTKDGSKADLSLNMYARYLANKYSKEGVETFVWIGCTIGKSEVEVYVEQEGDLVFSEQIILIPKKVIEMFGLNKPIFKKLCSKGLFYNVDKI